MAEVHELAGQVAGVDALAAAARVTPVDQERDAVLARLGRSRGHVRGSRDGLASEPTRPWSRRWSGARVRDTGSTFGFAESSILARIPRVGTNARNQLATSMSTLSTMDLTYPTEAEPFRKEIRAWLEENLPEGWFEPGFYDERRRAPAPSTRPGPRSSSPAGGSAPAGPSSTAARA